MNRVPIPLPDLGTAGEPVRVCCWLVEAGEDVDIGDRLVEVLVRGITFDVASPVTGTIVGIEKSLNAVVSTGDVLGWIVPRGEEPFE